MRVLQSTLINSSSNRHPSTNGPSICNSRRWSSRDFGSTPSEEDRLAPGALGLPPRRGDLPRPLPDIMAVIHELDDRKTNFDFSAGLASLEIFRRLGIVVESNLTEFSHFPNFVIFREK